MIVMATLVVGPFYLLGALHLRAEFAGLLLSVGPLIVALVGVPAGRLADRHGALLLHEAEGAAQLGDQRHEA